MVAHAVRLRDCSSRYAAAVSVVEFSCALLHVDSARRSTLYTIRLLRMDVV